MKYAIKENISGNDIKSFRKNNNLSRNDLAALLNMSKRTIEKWESNNETIAGPIVLLMKMLKENPEYINSLEIPEKKYPLRLLYMCDGQINTLIDVNLLERKIKIINYTNNILDRAFGNNENVSFEDYEKFIESRCFPKTRDKMKIQLDLLGLDYYDPLMIIEKTKGKMADDNYYIEIIRGN